MNFEVLFLVVVPSVTLFGFLILFLRTIQRYNELETLIEAVSTPDLSEEGSFDKMNLEFAKASDEVSSAWNTFRDSLVSVGSRRERSTDAAEHFYSGELVDPVLCLDFSRHVPGILTGVGIICTFFGMKTGLGTAATSLKTNSSGAEDTLIKMVQELLSHIEPAITLSLVAVACAIAFLFLERILYSIVHSQLVKLQRILDRKFPKITEGAILQRLAGISDEIRSHSYEAMNSLKGQNTDFAVMLEQAMSKALGSPNVEGSEVRRTLIGSVDDLGKKLDESIGKIAADAGTASSKTLDDLVGKFQNSLADGAHGQIQDMLRSIEGVKDLLQGQREAQTSFVESISTASRQLQQDVLKQIKSFPSTIAAEMARHQEELARASSETMSQMGQDVGGHLARSQEHQNKVLEAMRAHFDDSLRKLSAQIAEGTQGQMSGLQGLLNSVEQLSRNLTLSSQQVLEQGSKATADSLASLAQFASSMTDEITKQQKLQSERVGEALDLIGRSVGDQILRVQSHQNTVLSELRASFDESLIAMSSQITESSNASLAGFQGLLNSVEQLSNNTVSSSQKVVEQGSQATVASIETLSKSMLASTKTYSEELLDTMRQFRVGFEASLDRLSTQVESSGRTSQETSASLLTVAKSLTSHVESSTRALATQLQTGTSDSLNSVAQNLQDLTKQQFGQVQVTMEQALKALMEGTEAMLSESRQSSQLIHSQMSQLVSRLDDFGSSAQSNNERFAATVRQATQDIERLLTGMETPIGRMKALSENFLRQNEGLEALSSQLGEASETLQAGAEQVAKSLVEAQSSRLQTDRSLTTAAELGKSVEQYQKGVAQVLDETRSQVVELKRFVEDFHIQSTKAFAEMKTDAENYNEAFHNGARKFLHEVDVNLSKGTGTLSGAIEELAEVLDDLREVTRGVPGKR